jgi:hypothetical protein
MSTATLERDIDGRRYAVTQLPAMRALRLLNRLGRIAGPALVGLVEGASAPPGALGLAAEGVFERLSDEELEALVKELLSSARVDGKELLPQFDLHFQGRMGTLFRVLSFALEANYGGFFGDLVAAGRAMQASRSAASSTSHGPPGA